jgi:hypothetical protein
LAESSELLSAAWGCESLWCKGFTCALILQLKVLCKKQKEINHDCFTLEKRGEGRSLFWVLDNKERAEFVEEEKEIPSHTGVGLAPVVKEQTFYPSAQSLSIKCICLL